MSSGAMAPVTGGGDSVVQWEEDSEGVRFLVEGEVHGEALVLPGRGNDVKEMRKDERSMLDKIWWFGVAHRRRDLR